MTALVEARRVHARHPGAERDSLRDVSLRVGRGEVLALLGPNGSGKSTLISVLGAEIAPRAGCVLLDGRDVRREPRRRFARRVARLPQDPSCPEGLRVEALVRSGRHPHVGALGPLGPDDREAVDRALAAMDLLDLRRRCMETLSGGERRRAFLAMVLAQGTDVLLLDEPTAALDLRHQWEVLELLARSNRERGVTIVAALHEIEHAAHLAHRVAVLYRARLYDVGAPERCIREDMLRDVFGVDGRVEKQDAHLRVRVLGRADPVRSL